VRRSFRTADLESQDRPLKFPLAVQHALVTDFASGNDPLRVKVAKVPLAYSKEPRRIRRPKEGRFDLLCYFSACHHLNLSALLRLRTCAVVRIVVLLFDRHKI
jgi:hypothetical protein